MPIDAFHVLHVFSLLALVGVTCAAFGSPDPGRRRLYFMGSGIASLLVVLTGFGLLGMLKLGWPGWAIVKIGCWLGVSMMVSLAYRQPEKMRVHVMVTFGLAIVALCMVYFKPF